METGTVESNGFTISSNTETSEAMSEALAQPSEPSAPAPASATAEAETAAPAAEKPAGKPRNDPRARVEEATSQAAAAKRERDEQMRENAALKARLEALERRPTAAPAAEPASAPDEQPEADHKRYRALPGFPKLSEFQGEDAFEEWLVAKDLFIADHRYQENRGKETQQAQAQQAAQAEYEHATSFATKIGATPEERQAFLEQIDPRISGAVPPSDPRYAGSVRMSAIDSEIAAGRLPRGYQARFGNFLAEQLYRSSAPKELALHFTANPQDVQRLSTLHPMQVIRELGKLEASFAPSAAPVTTGTAVTPPKSKASPPIQPVKGSSQSASDEPPGDDATEEAHDAYWSKQRKRFRS